MGQNGILLCFVEAMDFVNEQHRALLIHPQSIACLMDDTAQVSHASGDRRQWFEKCLRVFGDNPRQRGFAASWWAPQNHRKQRIVLDGTTHNAPIADDCLLPDHIIERFGAHACCEGSSADGAFVVVGVKETALRTCHGVLPRLVERLSLYSSTNMLMHDSGGTRAGLQSVFCGLSPRRR